MKINTAPAVEVITQIAVKKTSIQALLEKNVSDINSIMKETYGILTDG